MKIFGMHIIVISDAELNRRTDEVREEAMAEQRVLDSAVRNKLLFYSERYRHIAESSLGRRIALPADVRPRLAEQLQKNHSKLISNQ